MLQSKLVVFGESRGTLVLTFAAVETSVEVTRKLLGGAVVVPFHNESAFRGKYGHNGITASRIRLQDYIINF
jgi:hypothetical protein